VRYQELSPAPQLRGHVECFWFLDAEKGALPRDVERIVPDGCTELILHLGEPFERLTSRGAERQAPAFLVGQLPHFILLRPPREIETVGVRFRPAGARRFFRESAARLTGRFVPLDELWDRAAAERLRARLHEAPSRAEQVRILETALLGSFRARDEDATVARCAGFILGSGGRVSVADVARSAGLSERSLERRFQADLGLTPKAFTRIARLQSVLRSIGRDARPDWADVAAECSYFDQPHLIHDFRALTGETPAEFVRNQGRLSLNFTEPRRLQSLLSGA